DITLTKKKIEVANLSILELEKEIADRTTRIKADKQAVTASIKFLNTIESESLIEKLLSEEKISTSWNDLATLEDLQTKVKSHIEKLDSDKKDLKKSAATLGSHKRSLVNLTGELGDRKKIADLALAEKNRLLTQTKNQESLYKKQLAEAEARKQAAEMEIFQYESALKTTIEPGSLPPIGSHVIKWPLEVVRITQDFGDTAFSKTNYQIYSGKGHNGLDFGAPIGTKLMSVADGIVVGAGDTDLVCKGASYGKWIMIQHENGLNSIYGHLSLIKVTAGQRVSAGELIGYTGRTGTATGPHLHLTIAATKAMTIGYLKSKIKGCGTYHVPLGSLNAYLNPIWYL
ncbi:MAG: peptidoglycan DD-metalloendopeptidase family protein, partial [Nitrospirota bacterium]